jgi:hypothetical protein
METTNETVRNVLTSTIGKWIAGLFAVVLAPILPSLINGINDILGYDLSDAQVTSYSNKAALAIAGVLVTWLLNRGLFERKALDVAANPTNNVNPDAAAEQVTDGDMYEDEDDDPDGSEHVDPDFENINAEIADSAPTNGFGDEQGEEDELEGGAEDMPAIEDEPEPPAKGAPLGGIEGELPSEEDAR